MRPVDEPTKAGEADGIAVRLAVAKPGRWWLSVRVEMADGKTHGKAFEPINFTTEFQTRTIPFGAFAKKGQPALDPSRIAKVGLCGSGTSGNVLYVDEVAFYKVKTMSYPVRFRTNHRDMSLFEPGQPVALQFTVKQGAPANAKGLAYEVRDYFDAVAGKGTLPLTDGQKECATTFQPSGPGYYEVTAYWVSGDGARLAADSCIQTTGSLPQGHGTFAVMPRSLQENRERMARLGETSFFGLHGDHSADGGPRLSDYIGAAWGISGSSRWVWDEKKRPDRTDGPAAWAREAMAKAESKAPKLGLNNLGINHDIPKWARAATPDVAPGFAWADFEAYFRDYVKLRKLLYPHMTHRLYDVGWETNLNKPLTGIHKPVYRPEDVIELYRHAKRILDVEDPDALLVGPCVSSYITDSGWLTPLFEGGLMDLLGGFNCHGYHTPPPERSGLVAKTRQLRAQLAKYAPGRHLPLICSELGYRSQYGTTDRHKEHACWHVRTAIILKGEGFDAYMPFYSYDFPGDNSTWGICYNLDPKLKWGPAAGLSPKAATPALAVCIDQLEGTRPVSDARFFGEDIWGYVFARDDQPVLCLWAVDGAHQLSLPVGGVDEVTITDIMGRQSRVAVADGLASVRVAPEPIYVHGAEASLYLGERSLPERVVAKVFAGQQERVEPNGYSRLASATAVGPLTAQVAAPSALAIRVPATTKPGAFPVRLAGTDGAGHARQSVGWVVIPEPIDVLGVGPTLVGSQPGARVSIRNRGALPETLSVTLGVLGMDEERQTVEIPGGAKRDVDLPLRGLGTVDPTRQTLVQLKVTGAHMAAIRLQRRLCFLSAHERGEKPGRFPNEAVWQSAGSSGKTDTAKATFEWDEKALYLDIRVTDDVFHQTRTDGTIWREDGVQIAFDTHPELDALYEPLASVFTKKVTQLSIAKTPKGVLVWRDKTHNEGELPTGQVKGLVKAEVERDEATRVTHYRIAIPWQQIGLDGPRPGKALGIAVLVNDSDGAGTPRRGLELFNGIMNDKSHTLYGSILLERAGE
jgi:hypothetical protein